MMSWAERSIATFIAALMVFVPSMLSAATQSADSKHFGARFIDSRGSRIPSIYQGSRPNPRFAKQLYLTIKADVERRGAPKIQDLVLRDTRPGLSCRPPHAAQGSGTQRPHLLEVQDSCFGHYMYPEYRPCTQSCGGGYYQFFSSSSDADYCWGYYYPTGSACGGCALLEGYCNN